MTRTYKNHRIDQNINGKWIITNPEGYHFQENTLKEAKAQISHWVDNA